MDDEKDNYRGNELKSEDDYLKNGGKEKRVLPEPIDLGKGNSKNTNSNQAKEKRMNNLVEKCNELLINGEMEDALKLILNALKVKGGDLYNTAIIQSGALNSINKSLIRGITSDRDASTSKARIKTAIFYILEKMEEEGIDYAEEDKPKISDDLKILFLAANPSDGTRLKIAEECRDIETVLKMAMDRDKFKMKSEWAVTTSTLSQTILDENPNIVHFSGHGEKEGIILQDKNGYSQIVKEDALSNLFSLFKDTINCVILNSCYSKSQAEAIAEHIPYVIGMKKAVKDNTAKTFAVGFYRALGAGKDIKFAYQFGINAVQLDGISGDDIPILYKQ